MSQSPKNRMWSSKEDLDALNDAIAQFSPYRSPVPVLDKGFVRFKDSMGSDLDIVDAAKVSYLASERNPSISEQRRLIRYLMRKRHTSPFEMAEMKFHLKMPIFVARQWVRHRTASLNEVSGRYRPVSEEFHTPNEWRGQAKTNKQSSEGRVEYSPTNYRDTGASQLDALDPLTSEGICFEEYNNRLTAGVSREQARECLPLATYTEFVWKMDLHNLLHFLKLRMAKDAQDEIRAYANVIAQFVRAKFPLTWEAFEDYSLKAVVFSATEQQMILDMSKAGSNLARIEVVQHFEAEGRICSSEAHEFFVRCQALGIIYV